MQVRLRSCLWGAGGELFRVLGRRALGADGVLGLHGGEAAAAAPGADSLRTRALAWAVHLAAGASLPPPVKWARVHSLPPAKGDPFANPEAPEGVGQGAGPGGGARPQGRPSPESQWPRQPGRQRRWRRATATVSAGRRSGAGLAPAQLFRLLVAPRAPLGAAYPLPNPAALLGALHWSLKTRTRPPARRDASRCDPRSPASILFLPCSLLSLSSHVPSSSVCVLLQILFPPPHEFPEIGQHRLDVGGLGMDKLAQSIQKVAESPNWGA